MRITRIIVSQIIGVFLILGACASPVPATPTAPAAETPPATAPVATAPIVTAPAPEQTAFVVSELKINPEVVGLGDNVIISVNVANTGKERGTYTVVLKFNGNTVKTQDITLDGISAGKVDLSVVAELPVEYRVEVGQLTGILKVVGQ